MTKARDLADGVINTSELADGSITTAKIADGDITTAKIADDAITAGKINVTGNGTAGQFLSSDGDGSMTWADAPEPFSPTTVSGTTHTLDLSSANYFNGGTTTGNTTLAFSNVPTAKTWSYDITIGGTAGTPDFITTRNINGSKDLTTLSPAANQQQDISMKSDGTEMYILNAGDNYIRQYTLSTAWDTSTATYTGQYYYGGTSSILRGFNIDTINGNYWAAVQRNSGQTTIRRFTMSTPFDITTSTLSQSPSPSLIQGTYAYRNDMFIKSDGTRMWIHEHSGVSTLYSYIREYPLSTAWDLTSYGSPTNHDVTGWGTTPALSSGYSAHFARFNSDGTKFYLNQQSYVHVFSCSTPYDLGSSSRSYDGSTNAVVPNGLHIGGTNQREHVAAFYSGTTTGYNSEPIIAHTFTYPASVQNPTDIISTMEYQDKYKLEFITTDGGTNVWKTGHNKYQDN